MKWLMMGLLIMSIIIGLFIVFLLVNNKDKLSEEVRKSVLAEIAGLSNRDGRDGVDGKDGKTPIKGVDYFDGRDGRNGRDGRDGENGMPGLQGPQGIQGEKGDRGEKGDPGQNGTDGRTPEVRCNTGKNRWEHRYIGEETWQVTYDESNQEARCTPGV